MTPHEYLAIARERWRSIVAGLLLGLIVAGSAVYLVPREYAVPVTMMVTSQVGADASSGGGSSSGEVSSQRLGAYSTLLQSRRLARDVITTLGLDTTPEELAARIAVTTAPDSVLLTATVTSGSPEQAVQIANAVAVQFIKEVAELEQPADRARPPTVTATVFQAAELPAEQTAPRPFLYLALGAVLGLVVGLAGAVLRHAVDFRVRGRRQLEEVLGAPVLATIGRDPKIPRSPLVIYGAPTTSLAEAFRQLRTNVQFLNVGRQHKVILVTGANSDEGRTTTVCNLGVALAEAGTRVLILDADLRSPGVARLLRVDDTVGLTDVLVNRVSFERVLQPISPTLDVLPSGWIPSNPSELLGSSRMVNLISTLHRAYDVVLIDSAPLLPVTDAAVLAPRADGVLVVVRHGRTSVPELQVAKETLQAVSGRILGSVMTMVPHAGSRVRARPTAPGRMIQRWPYPTLAAASRQPPEQGNGRTPGSAAASARKAETADELESKSAADRTVSAPTSSRSGSSTADGGPKGAPSPRPRPTTPETNGPVLDRGKPAAR